MITKEELLSLLNSTETYRVENNLLRAKQHIAR